jgi:hypothetical protein
MSQQFVLNCSQKPLSDFREGMEITGVVEAMYLYHGIRVDLGGEYDG